MTESSFNRLVRRTAFMSVAFLAGLAFGIILLVGRDWIPGGIIVAATLVGLAAQIPVIRRLCSEGPAPTPPRSRPTG
jgi:hypothetical protein